MAQTHRKSQVSGRINLSYSHHLNGDENAASTEKNMWKIHANSTIKVENILIKYGVDVCDITVDM